ncbi:MAG: putative ABC transporter permease [Butyrivibrio sp.]|nr:putative ABC transporter permease [Acetatifactor muris]MCM1560797.1 putative ABC transporter permease [Butyrivibrio sp.]
MKGTKDMKYNWRKMGILVIIVSFMGFAVENIWLALTKGYINNRNMNLPFLLGYGLAMVAIYILFGIPSEMKFLNRFPVKASRLAKYLLYFLCVMICISIGEIILGMVTERLCNIEYWNYSLIPLHITKYTSVPTSMGFAAMVTLFMEKVFPFLMDKLSGLDTRAVCIVICVLLVMMLADFVISYGHMIKTQNFNEKWRITLS